MHQVAHPQDRVARVIGVAGFLLSLATLYFAVIRPPCLKVGLGPEIYIASKPRVGILATLVNEGAQETVITSGELKLDNSQSALQLTETALQSNSWEYDADGNFQNRGSVRFSDFAPFAIKPHDQSSASFWFIARDSFPLSAGRHTAEMVLTDVDQKHVTMEFEIELSTSDVKALYDKKKGKEQAGIEYPIKIISQRQKTSCPLF
jgi:hypothetical protein